MKTIPKSSGPVFQETICVEDTFKDVQAEKPTKKPPKTPSKTTCTRLQEASSAAKSSVRKARPAPDFSVLHQQWQKKLSHGKSSCKKPSTVPQEFDVTRSAKKKSQSDVPEGHSAVKPPMSERKRGMPSTSAAGEITSGQRSVRNRRRSMSTGNLQRTVLGSLPCTSNVKDQWGSGSQSVSKAVKFGLGPAPPETARAKKALAFSQDYVECSSASDQLSTVPITPVRTVRQSIYGTPKTKSSVVLGVRSAAKLMRSKSQISLPSEVHHSVTEGQGKGPRDQNSLNKETVIQEFMQCQEHNLGDQDQCEAKFVTSPNALQSILKETGIQESKLSSLNQENSEEAQQSKMAETFGQNEDLFSRTTASGVSKAVANTLPAGTKDPMKPESKTPRRVNTPHKISFHTGLRDSVYVQSPFGYTVITPHKHSIYPQVKTGLRWNQSKDPVKKELLFPREPSLPITCSYSPLPQVEQQSRSFQPQTEGSRSPHLLPASSVQSCVNGKTCLDGGNGIVLDDSCLRPSVTAPASTLLSGSNTCSMTHCSLVPCIAHLPQHQQQQHFITTESARLPHTLPLSAHHDSMLLPGATSSSYSPHHTCTNEPKCPSKLSPASVAWELTPGHGHRPLVNAWSRGALQPLDNQITNQSCGFRGDTQDHKTKMAMPSEDNPDPPNIPTTSRTSQGHYGCDSSSNSSNEELSTLGSELGPPSLERSNQTQERMEGMQREGHHHQLILQLQQNITALKEALSPRCSLSLPRETYVPDPVMRDERAGGVSRCCSDPCDKSQGPTESCPTAVVRGSSVDPPIIGSSITSFLTMPQAVRKLAMSTACVTSPSKPSSPMTPTLPTFVSQRSHTSATVSLPCDERQDFMNSSSSSVKPVHAQPTHTLGCGHSSRSAFTPHHSASAVLAKPVTVHSSVGVMSLRAHLLGGASKLIDSQGSQVHLTSAQWLDYLLDQEVAEIADGLVGEATLGQDRGLEDTSQRNPVFSTLMFGDERHFIPIKNVSGGEFLGERQGSAFTSYCKQ